MQIKRLQAIDAGAIVDCFHRVYANTYANELFSNEALLAQWLDKGLLKSVGAFNTSGLLVGHMGLTLLPGLSTPTLGNTVVDPAQRGAGVAWQVGAELTAWTRELGFNAFLHFPTTDHPVMQRQSVKQGYETGLMLGYIPGATQAGMGNGNHALRQAATVVYEPLSKSPTVSAYLPERYSRVIGDLCLDVGLPRNWQVSPRAGALVSATTHITQHAEKRGLARLYIEQAGTDLQDLVSAFVTVQQPCLQIDIDLASPEADMVTETAVSAGFVFCAWLPGQGGRAGLDVLRLQKFQAAQTELNPALENPVASRLLQEIVAA